MHADGAIEQLEDIEFSDISGGAIHDLVQDES